jgi:hypothetical protein
MVLIVPTMTVPASELRRNDVIVEYGRDGMEPWRGRYQVRRVSATDDGRTIIDLAFPSALCKDGCRADPRRCLHYGQGGRMTQVVAPDKEEVIVIRT